MRCFERWMTGVCALAAIALLCLPAPAAEITFNRDIYPILQRRCQSCHRPGQIGPMPLLTYAQSRPWAKAIREAVRAKKMPPWFADPAHGEFANNPELTADERVAIDSWVEAGAPEGSKRDTPKPERWTEGWNTSPDIVIGMPNAFAIPARKAIDYQYVILPSNFTYDRWVSKVEVRPSNYQTVHHAVVFVRPPGSPWLRGVAPGVMYAPPPADRDAVRSARETQEDILAVYTPGSAAAVFPPGMAKRIP
ncbi:MAG: thiol-disulfide isomerase, partial [Bryobacteraceae bacterium]